MGPNSTLMIHDLTAEESVKKSEEVKANAKESDRVNRRMYSIIDKNCGHSSGYTWDLVQMKSRADWYLTPKQAVYHNYANHVKFPTLRTRVIIETFFEF